MQKINPIDNPYKVLRVDPGAPLEVIKAAYRALLKSQNAHPDLGGTEESARLLIEAYTVLSDEKKREELDQQLGKTSFRATDPRWENRGPARRPSPQQQPGRAGAPTEYYVICLRCRGLNRLTDSQAIFYAKCGGCLQPFSQPAGMSQQEDLHSRKLVKPDEKLARHLYDRGMFVRALEDYRRLTELEPDIGRHHYMSGMCCYRMSNYKSAIKFFSAAVVKSPHDFMSNYFLGKSLLRMKNDIDAVIYLRKAIDLNPSHFKTQCLLGNSLARTGNYREAVRYLLPAAKLRPNSHNILYNLSYSFFQMGKLIHARIYSKLAKRLTPNTPGLNDLILRIEGSIKKNIEHAL